MSASLRAGTYDAGVSILRTCSLPDLTSIVAAVDPSDPGVRVVGHHGSPETGGNVPEDSGAPEMEGRNRDTEPHDKDDEDVFYEDAVASEEGEKGGTSEEEGKEEEEEEWSSSEDEDLQQLVQTLQNFVADASEWTMHPVASEVSILIGHPIVTQNLQSTRSLCPGHLAHHRHLWLKTGKTQVYKTTVQSNGHSSCSLHSNTKYLMHHFHSQPPKKGKPLYNGL